MNDLPPIVIPESFNYIGAFLTFSCQLRCGYCINHHGGDLVKGRWMDGDNWIKALNRIVSTSGTPITLQGGEPTAHKHFYKIVNGIRNELAIDVLTNLEVNAETFAENVQPNRIRRVSPYASIRVSYHHGQSNFSELTGRVKYLLDKGYYIGIWEVDNPDYHSEVIYRQQVAHSMGIDYRLKEFLGPWKGKVYGTYRYEDSVNSRVLRKCDCRTSELLIAPDGSIFRCHSDLYANRLAIGHILDPEFDGNQLGQWKLCNVLGRCSSCDVKLKTNRFQEYGHSSVEMRNISKPYTTNKNFVEEIVNTYGKPDAVRVLTK